MKIKEIKENYYFETLTENHDVTHFDCGDDDLNDFLKKRCLKTTKCESECNQVSNLQRRHNRLFLTSNRYINSKKHSRHRLKERY